MKKSLWLLSVLGLLTFRSVLADSPNPSVATGWKKQSNKVYLFNNGDNVGVGTQNPSSKLHVAGTVTATSFSGDGSALTGVSGSGGLANPATGQLNMNGYPIVNLASMSVTGSGAAVLTTTGTSLALVTSSDGGTTKSTWTFYQTSGTVTTGGSAYLLQAENTSNTKKRFFPAAAWNAATTNGGSALTTFETSTNKINYEGIALSSHTTNYIYLNWSPPTSWNAGTVTFQVVWTSTAGTGGVAFNLQGMSFADDDALDQAYGTAIAVTDTLTATGDTDKTAASSAVTIGGTPTTGDFITWRLYRDVDNGSDTLTSPAVVLGVWINYTETGFNDD